MWQIFASKNSPSTHHDSPQIHHDFTIKSPRQTTRFSLTPLKKAPINPQKPGPWALQILMAFAAKNYRGV
jgi:hypothetical protein